LILRRAYSYNDSTNFYLERWPPWRQETEYDAGLTFIVHRSDPRTGFIPINEKLSKFDMMNQFTTHVGSAKFAGAKSLVRSSARSCSRPELRCHDAVSAGSRNGPARVRCRTTSGLPGKTTDDREMPIDCAPLSSVLKSDTAADPASD
jgi:hypothetical protein